MVAIFLRYFKINKFKLKSTNKELNQKILESEVKGMDIEVDVEQGVVTLTGMVNSNAAKDLAGAISKNTNDVLNVEEIGVGCAVRERSILRIGAGQIDSYTRCHTA